MRLKSKLNFDNQLLRYFACHPTDVHLIYFENPPSITALEMAKPFPYHTEYSMSSTVYLMI